MKIVFHLNCLERGGAERVVSNLAGQFVGNGYDVYIATEWQGEDEYTIDERIHRVHVGLTEKQSHYGRVRTFLARIFNLRKFLLKEKPDIVIAFAKKANYRALTATIGTKIPVMISVRINPIGWYDKISDKIQIPLLFPRAAGCVFQTPDQRDFFPEFIQKKSRIILNALNPKFIGNPIPEERRKVVVHSGRLVDFKNQELLIQAFVEVHKLHPEYSLELYGPDSFDGTKEILEALIAKEQASEYVKLMGGSDTLEKDMIDGAFAVFTSDYEGMPNAMLEAMALGLPTIATDCPPGGPRMVIQSGVNGILFPVRDKEALVNAMNYFIDHPEEAEEYGRRASEISKLASSEIIYKEWEEYILEICKQTL